MQIHAVPSKSASIFITAILFQEIVAKKFQKDLNNNLPQTGYRLHIKVKLNKRYICSKAEILKNKKGQGIGKIRMWSYGEKLKKSMMGQVGIEKSS